jgi:Ca2+/H+ antiporter, TMEM165/GDT1 family
VAGMFALGAALLVRESVDEPEEITLDEVRQNVPARRAVLTAFGVLFAAEWGDASQIAIAGLAARLGRPVAVGVGAWLALVAVAGLAVVAGRLVVKRVPVPVVHRVAGAVFAVFAVLAALEAVFS